MAAQAVCSGYAVVAFSAFGGAGEEPFDELRVVFGSSEAGEAGVDLLGQADGTGGEELPRAEGVGVGVGVVHEEGVDGGIGEFEHFFEGAEEEDVGVGIGVDLIIVVIDGIAKL